MRFARTKFDGLHAERTGVKNENQRLEQDLLVHVYTIYKD